MSTELQTETAAPMVIFIQGRNTVLNHFIDEMAIHTPNNYVLNWTDEDFMSKLTALDAFIDETTYVILFNNGGIDLNIQGQNYWDMKQVQLYNIQVDSPIWYRKVLELNIKCMHIVSVDKNHTKLIQKYYPSYPAIFLPHGGELSPLSETPYESRDIDILYVGTRELISPPQATLSFFPDNGAEFLQTTFNILLKYPFLAPEQLVDLYFREAGINTDADNYLDCLYAVYYYNVHNVRAYYQEKIISALAEAHFHISLYGTNWEPVIDKYPEYVHPCGNVSPEEYIRLVCNSKISLNIQSWYKEGSHERVYNAMLNGAVCVTDASEYMKRHFKNGENIIFYDLTKLDELVKNVDIILNNPEYAKHIIHNQKQAAKHSTWHDRLNNILSQQFIEGQDFV